MILDGHTLTLLEEAIYFLGLQADPEPVDRFFTRQLHERVCLLRLKAPVPDWARVTLEEGFVTVIEEHWSLGELLAIPPRHPRSRPQFTDPPLIIFRGWGRTELIDGQSRVNRWTAESEGGPHRVLVVQPREELPDPFPAGSKPK